MSITHDADNHQEDVEYVGGLLKRVGNFDPQLFQTDFMERKRYQKTVYLIQAFDIELGFEFNWYLHGPYCPALADVGYSLAEQYGKIPERTFAKQYYEKQFSSFLQFIEPYKEDTEKLEISASLHFLWTLNKEKPKDMLIEWLLIEKDLDAGFSVCESVWDRLVEFDAISN